MGGLSSPSYKSQSMRPAAPPMDSGRTHLETVWKRLTECCFSPTSIQFATPEMRSRTDGKASLHLGVFSPPSEPDWWETETPFFENLFYISHGAHVVGSSNRSLRKFHFPYFQRSERICKLGFILSSLVQRVVDVGFKASPLDPKSTPYQEFSKTGPGMHLCGIETLLKYRFFFF